MNVPDCRAQGGAILWFAVALASVALQPASADTRLVPEQFDSLQAAIDASEPGDVVLVAAGTYLERIRLKAGVILRSAGDDAPGELGLLRAERTILDGGGDVGDAPGVVMAEGATLDGFTITRVGRYDDEAWQHHHDTSGDGQAYDDIGHLGVPAVAVIGVTCTVANNVVHRNGDLGIGIRGEEGRDCSPLVVRNVCYRNMGGGIGSMGGSTAIIDSNTCFENFFAGIGHDGASPVVTNNECYRNVRAGIGISEGASPIVRGNRCYENRRAGIGVRTGADTRPIVEDNDCYRNVRAGIGSEDEAAPVIRGNRCYENGLAGIGARGGARPVIVGNECYRNKAAGIGLEEGDGILVYDNHSHHNEASGLGFAGGGSGSSATVVGNRVIDNAVVAVGVHGGWTVRFSSNVMYRDDDTMPPVVMVFEDAEATFVDNTFRGGGVAGIRVAGTVHAFDNRFECLSPRRGGPPSFGVWALEGSRVHLSENRFTGWRHALHATAAPEITATGNRVAGAVAAAIVVRQASAETRIVDNVAESDDPDFQVLKIDGESGQVSDNRVDEPAKADDR